MFFWNSWLRTCPPPPFENSAYATGSYFTIMSRFDQLISLDLVKMTGWRDSSYSAPCSLLVGQSLAVFLGLKW